jgi:hypothetical protein
MFWRYYVLARVVEVVVRAPYAQVRVLRLEEARKEDPQACKMEALKDYDSTGDYGETATQRESPSLPE